MTVNGMADAPAQLAGRGARSGSARAACPAPIQARLTTRQAFQPLHIFDDQPMPLRLRVDAP